MGKSQWDNEKLFDRLLKSKTKRAYWNNIAELRKRGTKVLFNKCIVMTESKTEKERMIGVDILSQLSTPISVKPFSKEIINRFIKLLRIEKSPLVLMSILYGIGHNNENLISDKDIKLVASYKTNEHSYIRESVVFALLGIDNRIAIDTLIELSKDRYSNIRNWAVFGLGSMIDKDNEEINKALYERIQDKHQETKYEAIVGLAKRNDLRVRDIIMQELLSDSYGSLLFEAIDELQDKTFLPFLEESLTKHEKDININPAWVENLKYCINNLNSLNAVIN